MQPIEVHELAPPTCVLPLSRILILSHSSMFFNVAPSLFMSMSNFYFFPMSLISLNNLSPLSSIFIKGVLLIDAKACIGVDG